MKTKLLSLILLPFLMTGCVTTSSDNFTEKMQDFVYALEPAIGLLENQIDDPGDRALVSLLREELTDILLTEDLSLDSFKDLDELLPRVAEIYRRIQVEVRGKNPDTIDAEIAGFTVAYRAVKALFN